MPNPEQSSFNLTPESVFVERLITDEEFAAQTLADLAFVKEVDGDPELAARLVAEIYLFGDTLVAPLLQARRGSEESKLRHDIIHSTHNRAMQILDLISNDILVGKVQDRALEIYKDKRYGR